MKEYYVKYRGGAEDFLKEKLGVTELDFWFDTEQERLAHVKDVNSLVKGVGRIVHDTKEGEDLDYKTVVEMNLVYKETAYPYVYDFGYGYKCSSAEYMFMEGNYACDCNLSSFIGESDEDFPELCCGNEIVITDFKITKVKGECFK